MSDLPALPDHPCVDAFDRAARALAGVEVRRSRFSPRRAWWLGKRELAHLDADCRVDIRAGRRALREHRPPAGAEVRRDWLSVPLNTADDVADALRWLRRAHADASDAP